LGGCDLTGTLGARGKPGCDGACGIPGGSARGVNEYGAVLLTIGFAVFGGGPFLRFKTTTIIMIIIIKRATTPLIIYGVDIFIACKIILNFFI
jgi:hypothetical protein